MISNFFEILTYVLANHAIPKKWDIQKFVMINRFRAYRTICRMDDAVNTCDVVALKNIANSFNQSRPKFHCSDNAICLDEVEIKEM